MPAYATHTIGSKNPLKRWLHTQRFTKSFHLLDLQPGQRFLDYGCGDGQLSLQIHAMFPDIDIVAYDPAEDLFVQAREKLAGLERVTVTRDLSTIQGTFQRIACLETIEHMPEKELQEIFGNIRRFLREDGRCLLSFPIEHGAASLAKNSYRLATKRDKYASIGRTVKSFFGVHIPREPAEVLGGCNYIYSHIGFDSRAMVRSISEHFGIVRTSVFPFGTAAFGLGNGLAVVVQ